MTQHHREIKWFCRSAVLVLITLLAYVSFQREYNFAHWVPHPWLRDIGIPYQAVLYFESNADKLLHPLGAFILTLLLIGGQWPLISHPQHRVLTFLCVAMLLAEIIQWQIGRGFEMSDFALGVLGCLIAYVMYNLCRV